MEPLDRALAELERMHLRCDIENRLFSLVEQACCDCEAQGYQAGERDGIQECLNNPFAE